MHEYGYAPRSIPAVVIIAVFIVGWAAVVKADIDKYWPNMILTASQRVSVEGVSTSTSVEKHVTNASKQAAGTYKLIRLDATMTVSLPPAPGDIGLPNAPESARAEQPEIKSPPIALPPVEPPPTSTPIVEPGNLAIALADMQPGEWRQIGKPLSSFLPNRYRTGYGGGNNGAQSIIESWNSGVIVGDKFMFWGGGHADGGYTAFYAIDLVSGEWSRIADEYEYDSTVEVNGETVRTPSLGPAPTHTYDGIIAVGDKVYTRGAYRYKPGRLWGIGPETWVYDVSADAWEAVNLMEGWLTSAYNPTAGILYDEKGSYDPATLIVLGRHTFPHEGNSHEKGLFYDKHRNVLWFWFQYGTKPLDLYRIELVDGLPGAQTKVAATTLSGRAGVDLGPDNRLYFWNNQQEVRVFDPEANSWETLPAPKFYAYTNPNNGVPSFGVHSVYGKWRYIESLGVFLGIDAYHHTPIYWKPPTGATPPVTPPPAEPPPTEPG